MFSFLSLLAVLNPVQAQTSHYWQVTYVVTNGTWSYDSNGQHFSGTWPAGSNGYSLSGSTTENGTIQGTVTATLTWVPATGQTLLTDPPPSPVSIIEYGDAYEQSLLGSDPNTHGPAGTVNDGLNDTPVVSGTGYVASGYHLLPPQDGSSGTIVLPGVTLSAQNPLYSITQGYPPYTRWPGGQTSVSFTVYPITILLSGTTPDNKILVGQHCASSLTGVPSTCTVSNYNWSVSGTTFQSWSSQTPAMGGKPFNPDASYYVDGPGPLTNATAAWYWNDRSQTPTLETVICTATVTPPAGQGLPITVTATQKITVMRPNWTATGVGGYVKVNLYAPGNTYYEIFAGPTAAQLANGLKGGMNFTATVASPNSSLFGNGSIELAQLCTPGRSYTSVQGDYTYSQNGQEGLDNAYPYGWNVGAPTYQTNDLPGSPLADYLVANFTMQDQFKDFIMYYPPGSAQCIPLAQFIWSTNGYAVLPHTGLWSSYVTQNGSDNAGTVSPSGNIATFLISNIFPAWTQITGTGTFGPTSPIKGETFRRSSLRATRRGRDSSTTQRSISHQERIMNKQINEKASSFSLFRIEDAQVQHPIATAHFGRRSGPDPGQQAKNEKYYALDMAGFEALRAGQYADAETYARQVLTLTHGYDPLAPELLALAMDAQGKIAEALHAYKALADQGGDFPRIMLPYARLLLKSGQWAQAAAAYNKALPDLDNMIQASSHFSPDVPQPRELLVALHIAQGITYGVASWDGHSRHEEAMNEFDQALQMAPDSALTNYYYGRGWLNLDLRSRTRAANAKQAKAAFQKAAQLGAGDVKRASEEALRGIK